MSEHEPEPTPSEALAIGTSLGFVSGFGASLLVSAETIDQNEQAQTVTLTEEPKLWLQENIDDGVLPGALVTGLVMGSIIGWFAMQARRRGELFTGFGQTKK